MPPYPQWLHLLAWAYLALCFACGLIIVFDELRRPQKMMIMNLVWPITALYFGAAALWVYRHSGLKSTRRHHARMQDEIRAELRQERSAAVRPIAPVGGNAQTPTREQVAVATTHCGAGCTLGDIGAEWWVFAVGLKFAGSTFPTRLVLDFLLAWSFGVVFQYLTIAPMRGLPFAKGVLQAMRADTLSIVSFQMGLFGWMALTYYVIFPGPHLETNQAVFWFMMQVGMILGFFTSYPVNRFLTSTGWKEKMPQYKQEMKRKMWEEQQQRPSQAA